MEAVEGEQLHLVRFSLFRASRQAPPPVVCALSPSNANQRRLISDTEASLGETRGPAGRLMNGELSRVAMFLLLALSSVANACEEPETLFCLAGMVMDFHR